MRRVGVDSFNGRLLVGPFILFNSGEEPRIKTTLRRATAEQDKSLMIGATRWSGRGSQLRGSVQNLPAAGAGTARVDVELGELDAVVVQLLLLLQTLQLGQQLADERLRAETRDGVSGSGPAGPRGPVLTSVLLLHERRIAC